MTLRGREGIVALAGLVALFASVSCVYITKESQASLRGEPLTRGVYASVREGETRREAIISVFGQPTASETGEDGTEVLTYVFERKITEKTTIPFIYHDEGSTIHVSQLKFAVRDGVVIRRWREDVP